MPTSPNIDSALQAKDEAMMQCFRVLSDLTAALNYEPGRQQAARIIAEYYGDAGPEGLREADELIQQGLDAVKGFSEANNKFLQAVKEWARAAHA